MLYIETNLFCFEIRTKPINKLRVQNVVLLMLNIVVHIVTTRL